MSAAQPTLKRSLGLFDVTLFFVIAGSNLQWCATAAAGGASSLSIWVIGGLAMFVPLSIAVVYLGSVYPEEGGLYVWSKHAFGPLGGFMTGWTYWASNLPYFPALLYFTAGNALFLVHGGSALLSGSAPFFIAISLGGLALGTFLNILGLSVGKWLNNVGAFSRWTITLVLIAVGIFAWRHFGSATPITWSTVRPTAGLKDLIFWSTIAFAWTGPESMSLMAGEIRNPRRAIPIGLAIAAPLIGIIYIAGTASILTSVHSSHVDSLYGVMQAIQSVAARANWAFVTPIAALLVTISCLGSVGAWLGSVARLPFVAGIDKYLPAAFGRMHPKYGSPVASLLTQAGIAAIFVLLGQGGTTVKGAYDVLVSTTVLITLIPFLFIFASAIKVRADAGPESIRIPGGRVTITLSAIVGLITTAVAMALALIPSQDDPDKVLAVIKIVGLTLLMIVPGLLLYRFGSRVQATQ
jgi:amino acid transporter